MTPFESAARAAIANRLVEATREDYARALGRWLAFCAESSVDPADPPNGTAAAFRDFIKKKGWMRRLDEDRRKKDLSNETVRTILAALSSVYRTLLAQKAPAATWNPFDPDALDWPPSSKEGKTEKLPTGDFDKVLEACRADKTWRGVRDEALLQLLYDTGLRRMSAVSLRRDRIVKKDDGTMTARVQSKGSGGEELDRITIPEEATEAIARWLEIAPQSLYVFPGRGGKGHVNLATANRIFTKRGADVTHPHPHRLRTTFATDALNAGKSLRDVQAALLHKDIRSTIRYDAGLRGADVAEAVAKFRKKEEKS